MNFIDTIQASVNIMLASLRLGTIPNYIFGGVCGLSIIYALLGYSDHNLTAVYWGATGIANSILADALYLIAIHG